MTATEKIDGSGIYIYKNDSYFPIDNMGFGNQNRNHNFHFTTEINSQFTHVGGETFPFSDNDDVGVYINNQLVVDLGGVQGEVSGEVDIKATWCTLIFVLSLVLSDAPDWYFAD